MGLCGSNPSSVPGHIEEENRRNENLNATLERARKQESKVHKLLLLGAGESGKSTLFKQIKSIYNDDNSMFPEDEVENIIKGVHFNLIWNISILCSFVASNGLPVSEENVPYMKKYIEDGKELDDTISHNHVISQEEFQNIKALWNDQAFQQAWERRSEFPIYETAAYFFNRIDEISQPNYYPTNDDYLRIRVRTTGIVENSFTVDNNQFKLVDVGGQRNERKKWIHCFQDVTALIFVAAISEYDQKLFEDDTVNRMDEALKLFEDIANSRWFKSQSILLFLNKRDLFEEKIMRVDLCDFMTGYTGAKKNIQEAQEWIIGQFKSRVRSPGKMIYPHITCATDTDNIRTVFNAVKDIVIRASLRDAGLLS